MNNIVILGIIVTIIGFWKKSLFIWGLIIVAIGFVSGTAWAQAQFTRGAGAPTGASV